MPPSPPQRTASAARPPRERWLPVRNADSVPVPPGGCCLVTGVTDDGFLTVTRPTADGQKGVVFNSRGAVPPGGDGVATMDFPCVAAFDYAGDGEAPAHGERWGPQAGSWGLGQGRPGFLVIGDATGGLCNVVPDAGSADSGRWARVTDSAGDGTYSAEEVDRDALLGWVLVEGGLAWDHEGTDGPPLAEASLTSSVPAGTIHLARPSADLSLWVFKCFLESNTLGLGPDDTLVLDGPNVSITDNTVISSPPGNTDASITWNVVQRYQPTYVSLTSTTVNNLDLRSYGPGPLYIIDLAGDTTITGIIPPAPGAQFTILNASPDYALALAHDDAGSSAANRIYAPDATAFSIAALGSQAFQHSPGAGGGTGRTAVSSPMPGGAAFAGGGGSRSEQALTATGSSQGTAAVITGDSVLVTVGGGGGGVILPNREAAVISIYNDSSNSLSIYPPSGAQIADLGTNVSLDISGIPYSAAVFYRVSATQWFYSG